MLDPKDLKRVIQQIIATAEVIGDEARPAAAALMAEDLGASYPVPVIEQALATCRRELKGRLSLAAIIERIDDGHPAPSEAWAMCIKAIDERETIVWTNEMQRAWQIARPVMEAGDKVAARVAFIESYGNEIKRARADRRAAQFSISVGFDKQGRDAAVRDAVARGLLPGTAAAAHLLPAPAAAPPVALIGGKVAINTEAVPKDMREQLEELRDVLQRMTVEREQLEQERRAAAIQAVRDDTERRKKELLSQYEQASKQQGSADTTV